MTGERKAPVKAWKPGQSGNPMGKPRGARNKATVMLLKLMESGAKEITEAVISAAKAGDLTAAKMVLDRLVPNVKERPLSIELPDSTTADGVARTQGAILNAVASGDLLPGEAAILAGIVEARRKAVETQGLEQRIATLEGKKS